MEPSSTEQNKELKKDKIERNKVTSFVLGILGGIVGTALVIFIVGRLGNVSGVEQLFGGLAGVHSSEKSTPNGQTVATNDVEEQSATISVVKKATPAVVSVIVKKDVPIYRGDPFGFFFDPYSSPNPSQGTEKQQVGGGTGFFVSSDGTIVTNKHVVSDTSAEYTVITQDGTEHSATVLARDPMRDVAVVKIEGKDFPVLDLGDSGSLEVGQTVIAIGNSLGEFSNSVSRGIVSGLGRDIVAGSGFGQSEQLDDIIQTDAAINPGNSGGPLLDISGRVIGINTAVAQGAQNVGFALPINALKDTINQVKETGKISVPFLGVRYIILNKDIQSQNNLKYDYGALVLRGDARTDLAVIPGSPADKVGIVENDIILEINGEKVTQDNDVSHIVSKYHVGDELKLKIWHKDSEKNIQVRLEQRSQ